MKTLSLAALVMMMLASIAAQAVAIEMPMAAEDNLENKAEAMINVATKAEERVNILVKRVEENQTIIDAIKTNNLYGSYNEMKLLISQGSEILDEAEDHFENGNYAGAIQNATEAMRLFRDAYAGIHQILCKAGVTPLEETREFQAQGLLVAANRSIERIRRIRSMLNNMGVDDLLGKAEDLLNNIRPLLEQGDVSAAAHKLAEANNLISEAFVRIRHRAEEMIQNRAEKFVLNFGRIRSEIAKRIREEGLNETEVLEGIGLGNLSQITQGLADTIKKTEPKKIKDVIKDIIEDLRDIGEILRETRKIVSEKLLMVKVQDILANASALEGKMVIVAGNYCGQKAPEGLSGPSESPSKKGWWILADETGWIYVVGEERIGIMRRLIVLEGAKVTVVGRVVVEDNTVYIKAILSIPSETIIVPIPPVTPIPPSKVLEVNVSVERSGKDYLLKVTIMNVGNEAVVFPNSAYGITIERKVARVWMPVPRYTPISAQVLTTLDPNESGTVAIMLERPTPGTYRVVVAGWLERSRQLVTASTEFTIP